MKSIRVTFDLELAKKVYKKFFNYQQKLELKKLNLRVFLVISGILVTTGLITDIEIYIDIGFGLLLIVGLMALVYRIRMLIAYNSYIAKLEKSLTSLEQHFTFSFDENEIIHESPNMKSSVKWALIKKYQINDGDIYLFLKDDGFFDIISESIMGKELFVEFEGLMKRGMGE